MKRINIFLFLWVIAANLFAQDYYWYKDQKIFLQQGDERYVLFRPNTKLGIDSSAYKMLEDASDSSLMWGVQKRSAPMPEDVIYTSPSFLIKRDSSNMYVTERFYVKLKQKADYKILERFAAERNVEIVVEEDLPLWYVLSCTEKSGINALKMANLFYESGLFAVAEPEFINVYRATCVNDILFNQQWNLLNTGQQNINYSGLDINYCDAHAITSGDASIVIAVIDQGIASHFDVSHLHSLSFDAHTATSPAQVYSDHGTQCAGIIGAHTNNDRHGIAGIAPDCPMLSVSFKLGTTDSRLANGIRYAVNHGASVLNNSWERLSQSSYIESAIEYALINGRNGKGCVVVFSTGNNNDTIAYPANIHPDIITVGAMSPSAARVSYSNYGKGLDIMAPGMNIPTTIQSAPPYQYTGSFCTNFSGTSAACPHVAAVAGLILSINPYLTQEEVAMIIESTAQKVGNYSYDSIAPHGTWNNEMGYGLVDAYAAVLMAHDYYIQDVTYYSTIFEDTTVITVPNTIYAGRNVTTYIPEGDVELLSGSKVHYIAGQSIHLKPGFKVNQGAYFHAEINSPSSPSAIIERKEDITDNEETMLDSYNFIERHPSVQNNASSAIKYIRNGQLLIERDKKIYNAQGMQL
jgi:hypothetical protein